MTPSDRINRSQLHTHCYKLAIPRGTENAIDQILPAPTLEAPGTLVNHSFLHISFVTVVGSWPDGFMPILENRKKAGGHALHAI